MDPKPGAPPEPTWIPGSDGGRGDEAATAALQPGTVILHTYRIVRLINRGGMGEIYQAEHIDQKTQHAIKVILPELVGDETIVALFLREAQALRQIRHPAIVGYDGLFRDATGRLHLVMEYVDGPSLRDRLASGALTPEEVGRLRDRIAAGLAEAHDRGIFHRDISPDNVILEHGRLEAAKVIDFGIAKLTEAGTRTVVGESFAGKLSWASPEQVGLYGGQIDARSDIYSLGLVLAAAARGRALDIGRTMMATIEARKTVPALDGVPPSLVPQLTRMLAPDPLDRPQSMRNLVAGTAPPPPVAEPIRPPPSRRWIWMTVAPLLLVTAGGGAWWVAGHPDPTSWFVGKPDDHQGGGGTKGKGDPPPSGDKGTIPSGDKGGTIPSGDKGGTIPSGDKGGTIPSGDKGGTIPSGSTGSFLTGPLPDGTPAAWNQIAQLPPDEIFAVGQRYLTERGDTSTSLRLWFVASGKGSGDAAFAIARAYDPATWNQGPHFFPEPNRAKAREFYTLALQRGVAAARAPLDALGQGTTP